MTVMQQNLGVPLLGTHLAQVFAEQADAMIAKGAIEQAGKNIARLKTLCRADCSAVDRLALASSKASEKLQMQASAADTKPSVASVPVPQPN